MELFHGDTSKIDRLNEIICEKSGFTACYDISTQTYSRKVDLRVANALSSFGASAIRIATVGITSSHRCIIFCTFFSG
jgi:adenylosuccinate lyase